MADEAAPAAAEPAAPAAPPAPAKPPAKADPMAPLMAYLGGELSKEAFDHAKAIAGNQDALLKHLEMHLPMASFGKVQKMLGIEL